MTPQDATNRLLAEIGRDGREIRSELEQAVGEVTIAILSQNGGRHFRLETKQDITLSSSDDRKRLNGNMNSVKSTFIQVNSDSEFIREIDIVTEQEHYRRKGNTKYTGQYWCYIITDSAGSSGPGEYLLFPFTRDATTYYKFFYYRRPTEHDTDMIVNIAAIMEGVRAKKREYWPEAEAALQMYESEKRSEVSTPVRRGAKMYLTPNKQQRSCNRLMHVISRGG